VTYGAPGSAQEAQLWQHLDYEWQQNQDAFGMRVLSNPVQVPTSASSFFYLLITHSPIVSPLTSLHVLVNPVQEDTVWMNGPPTWSYLQLARRGARPPPSAPLPPPSAAAALEPFRRMSENFRVALADQWNLRALTHTQTGGTPLERGAPREQGHYAFMLTDLYLLPLMSGLRVDLAVADPAAQGTLTMDPMFAPPFRLPVLLAGCEGSLVGAVPSALPSGSVAFVLHVAFGSLQLPAGGLVVCGVRVPLAVDLAEDGELAFEIEDVSGCKWR